MGNDDRHSGGSEQHTPGRDDLLKARLRQMDQIERIIDAQLEHFTQRENPARDLADLLISLLRAREAVLEERAAYYGSTPEASPERTGLDFGDARHEVCRRLARLRRCCGANRVPREP